MSSPQFKTDQTAEAADVERLTSSVTVEACALYEAVCDAADRATRDIEDPTRH